ncbi:MAG: DNA polymerase III subunit epsilon [Gammaproteobacteria bacterium]|nr:DNA polymerase III subunit epsilon [Gammaproteobacteria bacterium]NNC98333.1 DNA polymerase III subunit epsilon [Gammaproteobacteria bacterium]NNM14408.1 DNA polymerase III subunit epsilon [Gammaproteobacteria bacterium]
MRQIVLDTETTGLEPRQGHRIIEIGCIELIDRRPTRNDFHRYLNPERDIEAGAEAVHGLSREFLASKPLFNDVVQPLLEYIDGAELIIHNAPFDVGFLNHEIRLLKQSYMPIEERCQILDTLPLARQMHPGQRNSLDALCKRYGVDNSKRDLHGALLDARLLADVYLAMTGGQSTLFGGKDAVQNVTDTKQFIIDPSLALVVKKASTNEFSEHQKMVAKLSEQSGQSLWPED